MKTFKYLVVLYEPKEVIYPVLNTDTDIADYMTENFPGRKYEVREKASQNY